MYGSSADGTDLFRPPGPGDGFDPPPSRPAGSARPSEVAHARPVPPTESAVELALMSPQQRFEREYGYPEVPDADRLISDATPRGAALVQDLTVQATRMKWLADARRIAMLLVAYEVSMQDLVVRFGRPYGLRGGAGAQTFFRSVAQQTRSWAQRVAHEVDTATTLRDRLPATWAVFQAGDTSWERVDLVVRQADGLADEHWPAYDDRAAALVTTSSRLKDALRKARERLQDDTAAARARTTHERRHVCLETGADGAATLAASGSAPTWVAIAHGVRAAAVAAHGVEGETRTLAQLQHDVMQDILVRGLGLSAAEEPLVPARRAVQVKLILTVPALAWLGRTSEQAQLSGYGPIDLETAKALAGTATSFVRVLTDPVTGVRLAMDRTAKAPPTDLARWIRVRDGRSRFPGSNVPAHLADIDHAREWQHGGRTEDVNLITLDRASHLLKSQGLLQEALMPDGSTDWEDPWGHHFTDEPHDPLDPTADGLLVTSTTDRPDEEASDRPDTEDRPA